MRMRVLALLALCLSAALFPTHDDAVPPSTRTVEVRYYGVPTTWTWHFATELEFDLWRDHVQPDEGFAARGFVYEHHVWVLKDTWDLEGVVAHELGHTIGYEHTWRPTTMNPYGLLRWTDAENLRPAARLLLQGTTQLDLPTRNDAP